jgi:hypothetical protein
MWQIFVECCVNELVKVRFFLVPRAFVKGDPFFSLSFAHFFTPSFLFIELYTHRYALVW